MDTTTYTDIQDQETALRALHQARDILALAVDDASKATSVLREMIVRIRTSGLLTVDEMAKAIGRTRNYVDSIWSVYGAPVKGKQTRVPLAEAPEDTRAAYGALQVAASVRTRALAEVSRARAERDRVIALAYGSKLVRPHAIADATDIDRNHVGRIVRNAGLAPVHRKDSKNQYTSSANA